MINQKYMISRKVFGKQTGLTIIFPLNNVHALFSITLVLYTVKKM